MQNEERLEKTKNEQNTNTDTLQTERKNILSRFMRPLIFIAVVVVIVVSNIITGTMAFKMAYVKARQIFLKNEGVVLSKKYMGPLFNLEPQIYMLRDNDGDAFLHLNLFFELESPRMIQEIRQKKPRLYNIMNEVFTNQPSKQFYSSTGIHHAQRIILERVNKILESGSIVDIYITDFRITHGE